MHRIYNSDLCDKSLDIESTTMDDFFSEINFKDKINFIKIDTEGSEMKVLAGIEKILESNDATIQIEYNPSSIRESGFSPKSLPDFLIKMGFDLMSFNRKLGKFKIISLTDLFEKYPETKNSFVNIFCKKNKKFN